MTTRIADRRTVAGLHTTIWPGPGPIVIGLAGLTSTGAAWSPLARALPETHFIAPDLRGRGGSMQAGGDTGLRAHARDMTALIDELDLHDVTVVGHSMGAYLAPLVAQAAPDRIRKLVLVDGGIRPMFPFFLKPALVRAMFAKQIKSLDREWPDIETFARKAKFERMVQSRPDLRPALLELLEEELSSSGGPLRPRIARANALADAVDCFFGPDVEPALESLHVPTHVLLASNKERDGQRPFISDKAVQPWRQRQPMLRIQRLAGNHITVLFAPEVREAIAS